MSTAQGANSGGGGPQQMPFRNIGTAEMKEILKEDDGEAEESRVEDGGAHRGALKSQYCVIDVRTEEEVWYTGKLAPHVHTLPIQTIMAYNAFAMDADDFEDTFGFEKPQLDETIVFTCKSGIRSVYACQAAAAAGYTNLVNYEGGATEWFRS